jgi:hypothetical protein
VSRCGAALLVAVGFGGTALAQTTVISRPPIVPEYVTGPAIPSAGIAGPSMSVESFGLGSGAGIIRVYKDFVAWGGENRDYLTLQAMGRILGQDWFEHPVADCAAGIPAGTTVVVFTSNSFGDEATRATTSRQTDPACQAELTKVLLGGGVLIVDMGDNWYEGGVGFIAPGATGTPDLVLPYDSTASDPGCRDATLSAAAKGEDGMLGTPDDHPIVKGPDGVANTADDLSDESIDTELPPGCAAEPPSACQMNACYVAHGNLETGITLPVGSTALATARFRDPAKAEQTVLAEYCVGPGRVILDTFTKEYVAHVPWYVYGGSGASVFLTNLLSYALSPEAPCAIPVAVDVTPRRCPNSLSKRATGTLSVAIAGTAQFDVTQVNVSTVKLEGVQAMRASVKDVTAPVTPFLGKQDCSEDCASTVPDATKDLVLEFDSKAILAALGTVSAGQCKVLKLTGNLKPESGGKPILGEDVVQITK